MKRINTILTILCLLLLIILILLHQIDKKSTTPSQQPKLSPSVETESKVKSLPPSPPPQPIKKKEFPVEETPQPEEDLNHIKEKVKRPLIPF